MTASWFSLDLLDTAAGQVLQTWELGDGDSFQLGRSRDADVVLGSPYVSRIHACMHRTVDGWELSAVSRVGVFIDGQRVEHTSISDGLIFRLAERGPLLRFRAATTNGAEAGSETVCCDSMHTPVLMLDERQLNREVVEIAQGDFFQELQQKVARLRARSAAAAQTTLESTG
jgi:hypothetical protein